MLPRWTFLPPPPPLALVRCATRGRKGRKSNERGFASKTLLLFLFPFEYLRAGSAIKNGGRAASSRPPHVGTAPLDPLRSSAFDGFFSLSVSFPPSPSLYSPRLFLQAAPFDSVSELAARNGAAGAQGNYKAESRERENSAMDGKETWSGQFAE